MEIYFSFEKDNYDLEDIALIRGVESMITFEIDVNQLNPDHKFFWDGRMPNAFFSLEPITPRVIKVIL